MTSGGDAPGMNAAVRAVVRTSLKNDIEVFGIKRGYAGMIEDVFFQMDKRTVSNIIQRGGTILKSARSKEFMTEKGRKTAYENLKAREIDGLVVIGGDGTFTGALVFSREYDFPIVGIPGTIDNDLFGTDFTIGYDTAVNTAMRAIDNIKDTANAHNRVFFIEVMGRDAGFIAIRSGIATGAESVIIPERKTDLDNMVKVMVDHTTKKTSSIIVVAEGDESGGAYKIAEKVSKRLKDYEIRVSILGHLQRGGSPTCMDRVLGSRLGYESVIALKNQKAGIMIGEIAGQLVYTPFEQACKHQQELNPILIDMVNILA